MAMVTGVTSCFFLLICLILRGLKSCTAAAAEPTSSPPLDLETAATHKVLVENSESLCACCSGAITVRLVSKRNGPHLVRKWH